MSVEDIERHLERLPREAWDRPTPPPPPWPAEERPARRRRVVLRPALAAAMSVALLAGGVGAGLLLGDGEDGASPDRGVEQVALAPVGDRDRGAAGTVRLEPRPGSRATVELTGLRPSTDDSFYELWLIGDDGELVSLGGLRVPESGRTTVDVELPVDPHRFRFFDVSREPADGDPAHSTISVLRGPAT
jgi:anti-sigma-K factor RskA